jgi:hypothetical protein
MAERKMKGLGFQRRRTQKAEKRIEEAVKKYIAEGLSEKDARAKAFADARDNPRSDWRA